MDNFPLNPLSSPYFLLKLFFFGGGGGEREREREIFGGHEQKVPRLTQIPSIFSSQLYNQKIPFWLCLAICKLFSKCKILSGENIFGKGKYFLVFCCILKIVLENIFRCLVTFPKMQFFYQFLTFSQQFFQLPNKFYNRKFQYINLKKQKLI